ncbi:hypothetical protein NDU88_003680 [Pleurodeles waltl]|uniref:Uncharacterized protein n=1 Tax=Pleurodeles waltl TaxID=8319 RepID=A0AAV7WS05_PLEWA|nr:hypothetical protein NDU88_003680 [Pleurodeles waltl]
MAGYEDQAEDLYYLDDTTGTFDQDLVYALDAGVRNSVNQVFAQAIQPIKHHLLGLVDQQSWVAPGGAQPSGEPAFAASSQASKQTSNPHVADFESLLRDMAREHDYNAGSQKKMVSDPPSSSSSEHSSDQGDAPPRKCKKKAHHKEIPTPKVLTFEPEDIVHPRSSLWLPPPEVVDYVETHIRHGFDKDIRSRLRSECPRPDFPSKVTETPELDPTLVTFLKKSAKDPKKGIDRAWRGCQDKLLDIYGPLTKILELAFQTKESGTECRSADACEHEKNDIRNPVIRIPKYIPERSKEEETIAEAGNPDIRVPDSFKSEDGLRVRCALESGPRTEASEETRQGR